jgi:hypothetical protein
MPKAAGFTMKLNPDLRAEFMTAINNGGVDRTDWRSGVSRGT